MHLHFFDIRLIYELITILNEINEVHDTLHSIKEIMIVIMIVRCLLCVIMLRSKLSLVIGSTRLDIVDPNRLAHVVLLDLIK